MSSSGFIPNFQLDLRNPYLAPSLRDFLRTNLDADGDNLVPLNINRRLLEGGSRTSDQTRDFWRFVVGLKGGLTEKLNWEVFYNQGENKLTDVQGGGVLIDNFAAAFRVNPANPMACANGDPKCVVINPFGPEFADQGDDQLYLHRSHQHHRGEPEADRRQHRGLALLASRR
jgi:iron complex outermembrane receptor protein